MMLVTTFTGIFLIKTSIADPTTIYVHPCESIQTAINTADPGDTIYVFNGTYEGQVEVNKSIILEGESNTSTIVIGGFNVTQNNIMIQNFNITDGFVRILVKRHL